MDTGQQKIKNLKNKKIICFILSSGRQNYLEEAVWSVKANSVRPSEIILIDDSAGGVAHQPEFPVYRTKRPRHGHWCFAFERALLGMPKDTDFFFVLHDDDRIKKNYVKTMYRALLDNPELQAVSCSLECIDENGKKLANSEFSFKKTEFSDRDSVLAHYLESCIPFPATFYRYQKNPYPSFIERKFGSFADGLFFAELARFGCIQILPQALYQYRRHSGQMSVMQSKKAEFIFLKELVRRSSRSVRSKNYAKASYRATLTSLNEIRKNQNLDSIYDQRMADLDLSWRAALSKPKLLLRAGLAVVFRPKSWRRSEASVILEHEKKIHTNLTIICFSKDRPMQLAALLQSLKVQARIPCQIQVIFKASNSENACAYQTVQKENPDCKLIEEDNFQSQVNHLLKNTGRFVCFATDDSVFFQPFDLEGVLDDPRLLCFSLRLGMNSQYCYTSNRKMSAPKFFCNESCLLWSWPDASDDYAYPMSLDGHIFRKNTLIPIMRLLEFKNPNELEDRLAKRILQPEVLRKSPRWMASYRNSRYVSIPVNRIQNTFENRVGHDLRYHPRKLLERFRRGERIDVEKTVVTPPIGAHQEYKLAFVSAFRKRSPKKRRV